MATTDDMREDAWAWPCPYCGTSNSIDSAVCLGCRAQLRDPDEDDLFTTVATDNAQMVDPDAPRVREALWSTEVTPEEVLAEEVTEAGPGGYADGLHSPGQASASPGPFSAVSPDPRLPPTDPGTFAAGGEGPGREDASRGDARHRTASPTPFGPGRGSAPSGPQPQDHRWGSTGMDPGANGRQNDEAAHQDPGRAPGGPTDTRVPPYGAPGAGDPWAGIPADDASQQATPDENGLSVAVSQLGVDDRERCAVPIGVCGALLGEQEVVLGVLAGQLMGHPSVLMVTGSRVLVANARRWKPVLDQFVPSPELGVHLRHDRDIASLTLVQGPRLTTLDGISDVAGAVELSERIRLLAEHSRIT